MRVEGYRVRALAAGVLLAATGCGETGPGPAAVELALGRAWVTSYDTSEVLGFPR
jgi:hypothetical protein